MITGSEKCHKLAVKDLSALLRGIKSNQNQNFYCWNCFHSFTTESKPKKHYNVCINHDYCYAEIPKENNKTSKYNHGEKSMKIPFIIYAFLESLFEKISTCHSNPEKSSTTKINEHAPSSYSLFIHCSFDITKINLIMIEAKIVWKTFVWI